MFLIVVGERIGFDAGDSDDFGKETQNTVANKELVGALARRNARSLGRKLDNHIFCAKGLHDHVVRFGWRWCMLEVQSEDVTMNAHTSQQDQRVYRRAHHETTEQR